MTKAKQAIADARANLLKTLLVEDTKGNGDGLYPDLPEAAEAFPVLNAMLTVTRLEGKTVQPATITFWMEEDGVKAVFNARHIKRKLWASAPSLMGVLGELESALTRKNVDWRSDAGTKSPRRS